LYFIQDDAVGRIMVTSIFAFWHKRRSSVGKPVAPRFVS
jgi:hypothetical protein